MKVSHIKILTFFGITAIIAIFIIQLFWVRQAFIISESQFENTITGALRFVAERIAKDKNAYFNTHNPVIKINARHYIVEVNSEIDAELLDKYLIAAFNYYDIQQDVEYSIFSCQNDEMVYCNYIQKKAPQKESRMLDLPKFEGVDYYFSVSFPHYPIISLNNIPMWITTSIVLILLVLFFIYALFVVFAQKSISEVQKDFINNMTHEFKTPIATISVIQQVISDPEIVKSPQRLTTYAQIIGEEIRRLNDQVEKVLNVTKLEKKQFELEKECIDVHEIIKKVSSQNMLPGEAKTVQITTQMNAKDHFIWADKVHFSNVLYNITENALKYSSTEANVFITTYNEGNQIWIKIQDQGEGIDKKDIKKIFDKFYRVPKGNTHNTKGFGLGLFYVKQIALAHRWKLLVDSKINEGTTFTICIEIFNHLEKHG